MCVFFFRGCGVVGMGPGCVFGCGARFRMVFLDSDSLERLTWPMARLSFKLFGSTYFVGKMN